MYVNEQWWVTCPDPRGLISVAQRLRAYGRLGDSKRKAYLCACAAGRFCTRSWGGKVGPVLDVLERYADRAASEGDLGAVRDAVLGRGANPPFNAPRVEHGFRMEFWQDPFGLACWMVCRAMYDLCRTRAAEQSIDRRDEAWERIADTAKAAVAAFVRDVFGNPFRPSPPLPPAVLTWNDATVPRIAEGIYDQRQPPAGTLDTARLGTLADALLDAGCDDEALIGHCRSGEPHVRGCWAVDLILERQ
jgi:hypothetical protein